VPTLADNAAEVHRRERPGKRPAEIGEFPELQRDVFVRLQIGKHRLEDWEFCFVEIDDYLILLDCYVHANNKMCRFVFVKLKRLFKKIRHV